MGIEKVKETTEWCSYQAHYLSYLYGEMERTPKWRWMYRRRLKRAQTLAQLEYNQAINRMIAAIKEIGPQR